MLCLREQWFPLRQHRIHSDVVFIQGVADVDSIEFDGRREAILRKFALKKGFGEILRGNLR